jgi:hypothetical protein
MSVCRETTIINRRIAADRKVSFGIENATSGPRLPGFFELLNSGFRINIEGSKTPGVHFEKGQELNDDSLSSVEISWNDFQTEPFGVWLSDRISGQDRAAARPDYRELRFSNQAADGPGSAGSMLSKGIGISPGRNCRFG